MLYAIALILALSGNSFADVGAPTTGLQWNSVNGQNITPANISNSGDISAGGNIVTIDTFTGSGYGLYNFVVFGTTVNFDVPATSSYVFTSPNVYVDLATATINTRGGRVMLTQASFQLDSSGVSTKYCCELLVNGVINPGSITRCQNESNTSDTISINPPVLNTPVGPMKLTLACSVSQSAIGVQDVYNIRLSGFEF